MVDGVTGKRMQTNDNQSRRKVLKTGAAVASSIIGIQNVAATNNTTISAEAAGIKQDINDLLDNNNLLEALQLLDKYGVEYTASYNSRSQPEQDNAIEALSENDAQDETQSDEISTQSFMSKGDSNITVWAWHLYDDIYQVRIDFTVEAFNGPANPDMPGSDDIVALGYSQPNEAISSTVNYGMTDYDSSIISVKENPVINGPGAVIAINDGAMQVDQASYTGFMSFDLDKDSSDNETIAGEYTHTWSAGNLGEISSVSYGWNGLGVSVDPGYLNDKWDLTGSDRF